MSMRRTLSIGKGDFELVLHSEVQGSPGVIADADANAATAHDTFYGTRDFSRNEVCNCKRATDLIITLAQSKFEVESDNYQNAINGNGGWPIQDTLGIMESRIPCCGPETHLLRTTNVETVRGNQYLGRQVDKPMLHYLERS